MVPENSGIGPVGARMPPHICGKEKGPDRCRPGPKSWERMPERHCLYGAAQQIVQVLNAIPHNFFRLWHVFRCLWHPKISPSAILRSPPAHGNQASDRVRVSRMPSKSRLGPYLGSLGDVWNPATQRCLSAASPNQSRERFGFHASWFAGPGRHAAQCIPMEFQSFARDQASSQPASGGWRDRFGGDRSALPGMAAPPNRNIAAVEAVGSCGMYMARCGA